MGRCPPPANLSASPASLYASQTVTASYSSIFSPTAQDWVGLYPVGAADTAFIAWQYTNGAASGSVGIVVPNTAAAGSYELRLFANNGYTLLATSNGIAVQTPPPANLSASPASLYASQTVTGSYSSIFSPTAQDWVGLYPVGAVDTAFIAWQYTNGSASGSTPIVVPNTAAAGSYELRLFSNNGYDRLATSNGITVAAPPPATLSVSGSASPGGTATATWASILAPTATDWIGLYAPAAADNAFIAWQFTTGAAAGSIAFTIPSNLAPGAYELRLFANNGYTKLATSGSLAVGVMKLSFIQPDHLNTPREVYDDQQQLRWRWDQAEPFGVNTPNENPSSLGAFEMPLRFPGQYSDKETNAHYNYFRYYDPGTGRYSRSDPIGMAGGMNTYSYADLKPTSAFDNLGLWSETAHNAIIIDAFSKLPPDLIKAIQDGSRGADMLIYQLPAFSHIHAMRSSSGESERDCRLKLCAWFKYHMGKYDQDRSSPDPIKRRHAYFNLGMALHPVMDSTSPEHDNCRTVWMFRDSAFHGEDPSGEGRSSLTPALLRETSDLVRRATRGGYCNSCYR